MKNKNIDGALPVPDQVTEPVVAFYLTQETDLPAKFQGEYQVVTIKVAGPSGKRLEKPALRVTFPYDQSVEDLVGLIGFGSDPRCHVLLSPDVASSVHCRVYAQLNSGPRAWLVEDSSRQGTQVEDDDTSPGKLINIIHGRRQVVQGLHAIKIGPYVFYLRAPVSSTEVQCRERWFRLNKPVLVTMSMLARQLGGLEYDWLQMDRIGKGGYGKVYRYIEKQTALYVAIKEEPLKDPDRALQVKKEVNYMETLRHPYLVDILFSECNGKHPVPTQYTAMPLYLGNLWNLLLKKPDIKIKERMILQVFEGMRHMHKNQILHRDLKPDNIFLVTESPVTVKIGDYGLATSLTDRHTLFETCGTAAYMAPEVFQRNILQTTAVDVFSLGATVFAILEHEVVMEGWYTRDFQRYNRVFENVANYPPKLYAGLVKGMMAPNPEERPSLDICVEVVEGKHYDWIKGAPVVPVLNAAPIAAVQHGNQRRANAAKQPQIPLDRARAWATQRKLDLSAHGRQPDRYQVPQQVPAKHDYRYQQDATLLQAPQAPFAQEVAVQAAKPSEPASAQGVNFQDGLPSYDEATSKNPFAWLVDSHEITKKRRRSKRNLSHNNASPVAQQRAKPSNATPTNPLRAAAQSHPTATDHQKSSSQPTSTTRTNTHRPRPRPGLHPQTLTIHRTGTGRIRKTTLTGIKTGAADMAKGLYQFSRGLGLATCNIGCLTTEGIMMCYDMATRKHAAPTPTAGLLLNEVERRLVMGMRARAGAERTAPCQRERLNGRASRIDNRESRLRRDQPPRFREQEDTHAHAGFERRSLGVQPR